MAKASYSNKNKGAPKAKPGTGLSAAQHYLGLVQNAQGQWVRPGAALATKTLGAVAENMGYQGGGSGRTPLANLRGERIGFVSGETGAFSLKGTGGKGKGKGTGHGASMAGVTAQSIASTSMAPFAEADIASTSLLGTQGKAYAAGRQGTSGTLLGATRGPKAAKEAEAKGKGKGRGKGKGKGKGKTRPRRPK